MGKHELKDPPESGIKDFGGSVVYANLLDDQIIGWIRVYLARGMLTFEGFQ